MVIEKKETTRRAVTIGMPDLGETEAIRASGAGGNYDSQSRPMEQRVMRSTWSKLIQGA